LHGPIPTPMKEPGCDQLRDRLVRDPKGPGLGVRPLQNVEYARLKGCEAEYHARNEDTGFLRGLLQTVPPGAAAKALEAALAIREELLSRKAGTCLNPEEEQAWLQVHNWLAAWKKGTLAGRESGEGMTERKLGGSGEGKSGLTWEETLAVALGLRLSPSPRQQYDEPSRQEKG
jgi:hypothetical protein